MKHFLLRFNWLSFVSMLALITIGAFVLASAGAARGGVFASHWKSMLGTAVVGLVFYFVLAFLDYRTVMDWIAYPGFGFALFLLVAVLLVGTTQFGGQGS